MGCGCVSQTVQRIQDDVKRGVHTDAHVRPPDVIINTRRDANHRDAQLVQCDSPAQAAVPADDDHRVNVVLVQAAQGTALSLGRLELLVAGRLQNRPPPLQDATDFPAG